MWKTVQMLLFLLECALPQPRYHGIRLFLTFLRMPCRRHFRNSLMPWYCG